MKSKIIRFLLLTFIFLGIQNQANALTIGPEILFDSALGAGANLFSTQGVHFDAATGYLAVSSAAQSISNDGITFTPLLNGTIDYRVSLISQSSTSNTVTGVFGTSNGSPADLLIQDSSGTLLTGTFSSFKLTGSTIPGFNTVGVGSAKFKVTGGLLAGNFGLNGGIFSLDFNITPGFTATSFTQNFSGSVAGKVIPIVPIPSSMLLMGTSLGVLLSLRRFKPAGMP